MNTLTMWNIYKDPKLGWKRNFKLLRRERQHRWNVLMEWYAWKVFNLQDSSSSFNQSTFVISVHPSVSLKFVEKQIVSWSNMLLKSKREMNQQMLTELIIKKQFCFLPLSYLQVASLCSVDFYMLLFFLMTKVGWIIAMCQELLEVLYVYLFI